MATRDAETKQPPMQSIWVRWLGSIKRLDRFSKLDLESTLEAREERRRYTFEGALTTLCVFAVVVLSLYSLYVERQQDPFIKSSANEWSIYNPNFQLPITCHALDGGCYVSNYYAAVSLESQFCRDKVPAAQQACRYLAPGETMVVNICYSTLPDDGVSVFTQASSRVDWAYPSRFKNSVNSETGNPQTGQIALLQSPVPGGSTILQYVQTENYTKEVGEDGYFRREFFPQIVTYDGTVQANSSHCATLNAATHQQTRLSLAPSWFRVVVHQKTLLDLCGSFGGIYTMVIRVAATILALYWTMKKLIKMLLFRGGRKESVVAPIYREVTVKASTKHILQHQNTGSEGDTTETNRREPQPQPTNDNVKLMSSTNFFS